MAAQTSTLHIRVDDDIKDQATLALAAAGLSVSDAVRLFLSRVALDQTLPLELKVPNAVTRAAMQESRAMMASRKAAYYMIEPVLFEAMLEGLSDQELGRTVLARMGERASAVEVDIDAI
jgi:DNA-damage-inducible protein J